MKKNNRLILIGIMLVALVISASVATFVLASPEEGWSQITLTDYLTDEEFVVPQRTYFTDGTNYDVTYYLTYPSGKRSSAASVTLSEAGRYGLTYVAQSGSKIKTKTENFLVKYAFASFNDVNTTVKHISGDYKAAPEAEGVYMRIQQNDTVNVNGLINVGKENKDISLCKYFIAPDSVGSADFRTLKLKFTDVSDENNYLIVSGGCVSSSSTAGWAVGHTYFLAGGNGQYLKGVERRSNGTPNIHVDDGYGCPIRDVSFYGLDINKNKINMLKNQAEILYNPVTQEIKVACGWGTFSVIDLDSSEYFGGEFDVKWNGFKSGIVKLSVYAENYNEASANVIFTSIKDIDLTADEIVDNVAPEITVDCDYDVMPEARVGANEFYPVPTATAFDLYSGECKVSVSVYRNYYNDNSRTAVSVKNGMFNTLYAETYSIVYTAKDAFGNEGKKVLDVHAGGSIEEMQINLPEKTESAYLGNTVKIPMPEITGGSGAKQVAVTVTFNGKTTTIGNEMSFVPDKAGAWRVEYTVTDYTGYTKKLSYDVTAQTPAEPYFNETAVLPYAYIPGFAYTLPEMTVVDYTTGSLKTPVASVEVTDKNGTKTYKSGEKFKPEGNDGEFVSVTYVYTFGSKKIKAETQRIPLVNAYNAGRVGIEKLFYTGTAAYEFKKTNNGLEFTSVAEGNGEWTFVNALGYNGFSTDINIPALAKFDSFVITLTDYNDRSVKQEIRFTKEKGFYRLTSDGVDELTTVPTDAASSVSLAIKNNRLSVNDITYPYTRTINSDMVLYSFRLENAQAGAAYGIYSVCGHKMTTITSDRAAPVITVLGDCGGVHSAGENYYISPAIAYDVISPEISFTLTVKDGAGNIVKDVNGLTLDGCDPSKGYTIKLVANTSYKIVFEARDMTSGNSNPSEFEVTVADEVAPSITFKSSLPERAKLGDKISLPEYSVSDDVSENITVEITVSNPNGRLKTVKDGFVCEYTGVYEVRYVVYDEAGNTTLKIFKVTVA